MFRNLIRVDKVSIEDEDLGAFYLRTLQTMRDPRGGLKRTVNVGEDRDRVARDDLLHGVQEVRSPRSRTLHLRLQMLSRVGGGATFLFDLAFLRAPRSLVSVGADSFATDRTEAPRTL